MVAASTLDTDTFEPKSFELSLFEILWREWRGGGGRPDAPPFYVGITNHACDKRLAVSTFVSCNRVVPDTVYLYDKSCTNWGNFFRYENRKYPFFQIAYATVQILNCGVGYLKKRILSIFISKKIPPIHPFCIKYIKNYG